MTSSPAVASAATPLTVLVHRPGRMMAIGAGAMLLVGVGLLVAFQFGDGFGRGWLNLLLMVPAVVGFVALMRTGTTRCEIQLLADRLVVRSADSSHLLGSAREAAYAWSDIVATAWVGDGNDEFRIDFAIRPRALIFSGALRDLKQLEAAARSRLGV